jgi:hypothetical protein
VAKSTIAVASGLTFVRAFVALMDPSDGSIYTVKAFTHATNLIYVRPAISAHYIADSGNPASSIDLWRIAGRHLITLASNLRTQFPFIRGLAVDGSAGLLFDSGANDVQVRDVQQPKRVISKISLEGTVNCLSADPAHRVLYACTTVGIIALKYSRAGVLTNPVTVDSAIAEGVTIGPDGKDLIIGSGGVTYLPEAFGTNGNDAINLAVGESSTLGAAVTPTAVVTSGLNADLQLYSSSGANLDTLQLGSLEATVTVLWPDGDGLISGSTFDGSLFTLPPTRPADALKYACALLADPGAEWRTDYSSNLAVARLLPFNGGC